MTKQLTQKTFLRMQTKLISITRPLIEGINTPGELIAYTARVSNPGNQLNTETAPKLLKYLIRNKHWSPFEMVHATFEINTTRDIARQILRHRSFSFQEFSQRYADASQMGFEFSEARLQDAKNRQNSVVTDDQHTVDWWEQAQKHVVNLTKVLYQDALNKGLAKEQARKLLPEGLTGSRLYMSGSIRSWIHYCSPYQGVRAENGTQKEHRDIALSCWDQLLEAVPELELVNEKE